MPAAPASVAASPGNVAADPASVAAEPASVAAEPASVAAEPYSAQSYDQWQDLNSETSLEWLLPGKFIEVQAEDDEGFRGAWFPAEVQEREVVGKDLLHEAVLQTRAEGENFLPALEAVAVVLIRYENFVTGRKICETEKGKKRRKKGTRSRRGGEDEALVERVAVAVEVGEVDGSIFVHEKSHREGFALACDDSTTFVAGSNKAQLAGGFTEPNRANAAAVRDADVALSGVERIAGRAGVREQSADVALAASQSADTPLSRDQVLLTDACQGEEMGQKKLQKGKGRCLRQGHHAANSCTSKSKASTRVLLARPKPPKEALKHFGPEKWDVGQQLEVMWNGCWWPAVLSHSTAKHVSPDATELNKLSATHSSLEISVVYPDFLEYGVCKVPLHDLRPRYAWLQHLTVWKPSEKTPKEEVASLVKRAMQRSLQ